MKGGLSPFLSQSLASTGSVEDLVLNLGFSCITIVKIISCVNQGCEEDRKGSCDSTMKRSDASDGSFARSSIFFLLLPDVFSFPLITVSFKWH